MNERRSTQSVKYMEKGDIPILFAPFVRLPTLLTEKTSGTGIGLYLVKKLAKDFLGEDVIWKLNLGRQANSH
jgi:signal transduction histidine kinase